MTPFMEKEVCEGMSLEVEASLACMMSATITARGTVQL